MHPTFQQIWDSVDDITLLLQVGEPPGPNNFFVYLW